MRDGPAGRRISSGVHRRVDADESEPQKHLGVNHCSGKALDRQDPEDEQWDVCHRLHPTDSGEDQPSPPEVAQAPVDSGLAPQRAQEREDGQ